MPNTRDPTRYEPPLETTRARLVDGQRATAQGYEDDLAALESLLDQVPALCERLHRRRAALVDLAAQAAAYDAQVRPVARAPMRGPFMRKLMKAQQALNSVLGA